MGKLRDKSIKSTIIVIGSLLLVTLVAVYGEAAIKTISGMAVSESRTKWNSVKDAAQGDNLTNGIPASAMYGFDGTNFDRVLITGGALNVTSGGGAVTPSDTFANPADASNGNSLVSFFNGATWDRMRGDIANGLDVDVTRIGGTVTIDGSGVTQPISAVALPLPAGAATSANQLPDGHNVTVDNAAAGSAVNIQDGGNLISIDDGGGSITVDGAVSGSLTISDGFTNPTNAIPNSSMTSEYNGTTWDRIRHSYAQAVTGIAADSSAGTILDMTQTPMSKFTMVIDRTAGATDVVEVDIECSLDGTIFVQVATVIDLASEPALISTDGTPCRWFRYNVVTVGAGNTLTVQLLAMR